MQFEVVEIDFHFGDDGGYDEDMTEDEINQVYERTLAKIWEADDEDDLIEKITSESGWLINAIDYQQISN